MTSPAAAAGRRLETLDSLPHFYMPPSPPTINFLDFFTRSDSPQSEPDFLAPDLFSRPLADLVLSGFDSPHIFESDSDSPDGLRIFGSDSESDSDIIPAAADPSPDLCWDCFRIDGPEPGDDFDWEEVDNRLDDRALLSMMVGEDEEEEIESPLTVMETSNVEWEVLLAGNNLAMSMSPFVDEELYYGDDYEFDVSEYEVMFGQFADHESAVRGCPAAAKAVVKGLKTIVLTEEDRVKGDNVCAVCKDDISVKEEVKQLPCMHYYHGECILPWLGMRNTCPVCRFELPTDDAEYESWRGRRAGGTAVEETLVRYDVEMPQ